MPPGIRVTGIETKPDKEPEALLVDYVIALVNPLTDEQQSNITKFLGLKPPRDRLQRAINFSSFKVLKGQEEKDDFKERPKEAKAFFRTGKRDQWRDVLSPDQVRRIISDHREQMERFASSA